MAVFVRLPIVTMRLWDIQSREEKNARHGQFAKKLDCCASAEPNSSTGLVARSVVTTRWWDWVLLTWTLRVLMIQRASLATCEFGHVFAHPRWKNGFGAAECTDTKVYRKAMKEGGARGRCSFDLQVRFRREGGMLARCLDGSCRSGWRHVWRRRGHQLSCAEV